MSITPVFSMRHVRICANRRPKVITARRLTEACAPILLSRSMLATGANLAPVVTTLVDRTQQLRDEGAMEVKHRL
jgi:hypothetical protein